MATALAGGGLKSLAFEALADLESAIFRLNRKAVFTAPLPTNPHASFFEARSPDTGAYLRVCGERGTVRFETFYLKGGEQKVAGFDIDFNGDLQRLTLDQLSDRYLKASAAQLANIVCEDVFEDSKSLLMV